MVNPVFRAEMPDLAPELPCSPTTAAVVQTHYMHWIVTLPGLATTINNPPF